MSHTPASRDDVANLQKLLDERLLDRQARYATSCFLTLIRPPPLKSSFCSETRLLYFNLVARITCQSSSLLFCQLHGTPAQWGELGRCNRILLLNSQGGFANHFYSFFACSIMKLCLCDLDGSSSPPTTNYLHISFCLLCVAEDLSHSGHTGPGRVYGRSNANLWSYGFI